MLLSFPAALVLSKTYQDYTDRKNAELNGAVLPPKLEDWTPGSLRLLGVLVKNFNTGYPGQLRTLLVGHFLTCFTQAICG